MQIYIANKNYSSWSMRPWLVLEAFELPYTEVMIPFSKERYAGQFKKDVLAVNPNGKVPALVDDGFLVWDSMAICEYLAEKFPEKALWPQNIHQRARARSISAEMHSGFENLRNLCGMNIREDYSELGKKLWSEDESLRKEVERIEQIWADRPSKDGFLCGDFSIADAFYAPVVTRFKTYALPVSENAKQYIETLLNHPAVQNWVNGALAETAKVEYLEPTA